MKRTGTDRRPRCSIGEDYGATMVEYSLMVAFIAMVAFGAAAAFGGGLAAQFTPIVALFP